MTRQNLPRVNFFDGQEVIETDLDVEQTAWHDSLANNIEFSAGSGIEKELSIQRELFDSNDVPASISTLITNQTFDGEPIYPTDSLGSTVYIQPSDSSAGNQLEVELSGAALDGTPITKVYIFGKIFGGTFSYEVITFEQNESQLTRKYFTEIIAIMTQNFRGNQNTIVDGVASSNLGGILRILESIPMTLSRDSIMAKQAVEPNMDFVGFKPATASKTLDTILGEIADSADLQASDLNINVTSTDTRELPATDSTGIIVGEKFKATTDNIQKISVLLSVKEDTLAVSGEEFDWSGDIVIGVRPLQTTVSCPTDTLPNTSIEFDPELSPIAEVSFDQAELADIGIVLTNTTQVVDFVFTQSLLANPNIEPTIEVGKYYILTIRRSGDISVGDIILQEAANTTTGVTETDEMRMSVFSQNKWVDVSESDLWFKIHTDAVRISDGTAFDDGIQITSPKTKTNTSTGVDEPYVEGNHSFIDVSQNSKNYVILQKAIDYTVAGTHPSTGNPVFTRIEDIPDIAIVSESTLTTLIAASSEPIVVGSAKDINPVGNPAISGRTDFPGLLRTNTFTIIQPNSDIQVNNLVGSTLVPNISKPLLKYRIIKAEIFDDAYGDVTGNGTIDLNDVSRAQALDGYSKDLASGTVASIDQRNAIVNGTVTMEEILRADVTGDGIINILDPQGIQQNIVLGTSFTAGSSFKRAVLTVENITSPLTTTVGMLAADSSFNTVSFVPINFRIDFVPLWYPHNLELVDLRRFIPKTFTQLTSGDITGTVPNGGKNTAFVPGDILLEGDLLDSAGELYSIDLEANTMVIDLPEGSTQGEIDIFNNFIKNQMYFYDGTLVTSSALTDDQVKVISSIQSFVKDEDGYDFPSIDGFPAIKTTVAALYTQSSGILRIRADNIRNITTRSELRTKIVLTVLLKKAGFRNTDVSVSSTQLTDLLTLI